MTAYCAAHIEHVCTGMPTDCHHILVRRRPLGAEELLACCRSCYCWIIGNPKAAAELGLIRPKGRS